MTTLDSASIAENFSQMGVYVYHIIAGRCIGMVLVASGRTLCYRVVASGCRTGACEHRYRTSHITLAPTRMHMTAHFREMKAFKYGNVCAGLPDHIYKTGRIRCNTLMPNIPLIRRYRRTQ
jgi:hypothetical protein